MKVLIVSDTHGRHGNLDKVLETEGAIDMFIHLGDVEGGEEYLEAVIDCEKHIVAGNNDYFSQMKTEQEFFIGSYRAFIAHGHNYYVSVGTKNIEQEGKRRSVDFVMFGHTHRPIIKEGEDITILNPGSLSYPRQGNRRPSYIIMNMEVGEKPEFLVKYI